MSEVKKLYRVPQDGMIAGICAGLAEYFAMDVSLVRILMVASLFISGVGAIFYIVAWIILPVKVD